MFDEYKESWLEATRSHAGARLQRERLTAFTTRKIQELILEKFGSSDIERERRVAGQSALAFDLWNREERTAYEISLGAVKNEFEKDVLKGLLDTDTIKIVILFRRYRYGKANTIFDEKWFQHPAQQEIISRSALLKLKVEPVPLLRSRVQGL
jgi:hypothetical protein